MIVRTTKTHTNSGPLGGLFGSIVMAVIGIVFFVVSGFMSKQDANLKERCTIETQAKVVGFEYSENRDSKDSKSSTPLFEYSYNNETYTSKTGSYSSSFKDKFRNGQIYTIFVNPDDPQEIYSLDIAKSDGTVMTILRWGGVALVIFGIIAVVISIIKIVAIGGAIGWAASTLLNNRK